MASIKFIQRAKALNDGTYSIVLRIIKDRKKKLISLGMSCSKSDFENQEFKRSASNSRKRNQLLLKLKTRAYEIIDEFKLNEQDFTLEEFEYKFRGLESKQNVSVIDFFDTVIDEYKRSGRVGNARAYEETKKSLFKFTSNKLRFKNITPDLLERYEVFMRERGNEDGGISFKMRELRALCNKAIARGLVDRKYYPFDQYKISKLKKKSMKRALTIEEFRAFKEVDLSKYPHLQDAQRYFLFSFYTRGMNFVDMMKLRWSDIQGSQIYYVRSKTKGAFNIKVLPKVQDVLDYYSNLESPTSYVFPILLKEGLSQKQIAYRKKKTLRKYNADLKEIAVLAGITKNLTSYVARHSYATIMKKMGVATDLISESMGHANLDVTNTYLKEFENDVIDNANDYLNQI